MPTFYMMCGLPGSGKSRLAETLNGNGNCVVHASDAIRAEILGDESDQTQQQMVFNVLHRRVKDDLRAGKSVIYDATNISYKRRMAFLNELDNMHLNLYKFCCFVATPYEKCLERNANRGRVVPENVIRRMYSKFDVPAKFEGWDDLIVFNAPDYNPGAIDQKLKELSEIEQDNPYHSLTIGQHCIAAWAALSDRYPDESNVLKRATLLHDFGKEKTKVFTDSKGEPSATAHFYGHEYIGSYDSFCYTGDMGICDRLMVAELIRWHMAPFTVSHSEKPAKTEEKYKRLLGDDVWRQIQILHDCDVSAH